MGDPHTAQFCLRQMLAQPLLMQTGGWIDPETHTQTTRRLTTCAVIVARLRSLLAGHVPLSSQALVGAMDLLPLGRQRSDHISCCAPRTAPIAAVERMAQQHPRRRGVLVYSHYYAKDTPASHQRATNVACVALFAIAGTALRHACGELAMAIGITPAPSALAGDLGQVMKTYPLVSFHYVVCVCILNTRTAHADRFCSRDIDPSYTRPALSLTIRFHTYQVLFHDLLANCLGSFFMGVAVGVSPYALPRFPNLYVGLTTGLCGCLTTFSGWNAAAAAIFYRWTMASIANSIIYRIHIIYNIYILYTRLTRDDYDCILILYLYTSTNKSYQINIRSDLKLIIAISQKSKMFYII